MKPTTFVLLTVTGVVSLLVLLECVSAGPMVCPHCVCPPSYSPVCGYRKSTNTTRGFPSRCVLECSNKCRRIKYEFVYNGRCGKWVSSTSTEAPPTPQAVARASTEPPVPPVPVTPSTSNEEQNDFESMLEPSSER